MTKNDGKNENKDPGANEAGSKSNENTSNKSAATDNQEKYGFDMYPERRGEKYKRSWLKTFLLLEGREGIQKIRCEQNVYKCVKESPLVQLMMAALKSSGCGIDIRRHISCEICDTSVSGGYDTEFNQIVICQNTSKDKGYIQGVLTHEMIHMFDYCRNNLDFKNIDHLACTEIRAANLTHCSFLSACTQGDASFINVRNRHQDCVKRKAVTSVIAARNVTFQEAKDAVERTFPKCYPDLEPIGRRLRPGSNDMYRAYMEGPYYGYNI